jgi:hypothetical protein
MVNARLLARRTWQQLNRDRRELKIWKITIREKSIHLSTLISTMLRVRFAFLSSFQPVLWILIQIRIRIHRIRIHRIHMFLGHLDPDPDPLVRGMDPAPDPDLDSSITKQNK